MNESETIAAISTPPGIGALAVVRISGTSARSITQRLFAAASRRSAGEELKSHRAYYGKFHDLDGAIVDDVVVVLFQEPHSYTGEDLVEISCHGSPLIAKKILSLLVQEGSRLARPGEFTERAFLNGRIDLSQAEAVLDLIQSRTARQSRNALSILAGELGNEIETIRLKLLGLLTDITAGIDFPDEVGEMPALDLKNNLIECELQLNKLASTARSGRFLREGLKVAIVGRPNAGKSSLLNQLLQYERAIVSDTPGTTRDIIEELIDLDGLPVKLIDTAGLRQTSDTLEEMGMERTKRAIAEAELILHLTDSTTEWQAEEEEISGLIGEKAWFLIMNKIDLLSKRESQPVATPDRPGKLSTLQLSAKTGEGLDKLVGEICTWALGANVEGASGPTLNERQSALCMAAAQDLARAQLSLSAGMPQDCLGTDLKGAVDRLSEISGEIVSEEVIASVFAKFCIGK